MHRRFQVYRDGRERQERYSGPERSVAQRATIAVGITALAVIFLWLAYKAIAVFFLFFAGVLMAVLLHSMAEPLARRTRWPIWAAVTTTVLLLLGLLTLAGWWIAPSVSQQFSQLWEQLPSAIDRVRVQLHNYEWTNWLLQQGAPNTDGRKVFGQVTHAFQMTFGAVAAVVIVGFLALYMAAHPKPYVEGVVRLMPVSFRPRMRELLAELYRTLRLWLMTKLLTMTFTGIGIGIGVYFLKVPLALALGILAGLLEFIPTVGPLLSAIPAILLALVKSPMTALYVALLYFGVQWIGNHVTTPLLQQKTLAIPPAVSLALVALLGAIFGFPGLLLSGPLSVVVVVATKMLYVEDVLERRAQTRSSRHVPPRSGQRQTANATQEA